MRILITGGAGCLGSNLTERYLRARSRRPHHRQLRDGPPRLAARQPSAHDGGRRLSCRPRTGRSCVRRLQADTRDPFGRRLQGSRRLARGCAHQHRGHDQRRRRRPRRPASSGSSISTPRSVMAGRNACRSRWMHRRGRSRATAFRSRPAKITSPCQGCRSCRCGSPTSRARGSRSGRSRHSTRG